MGSWQSKELGPLGADTLEGFDMSSADFKTYVCRYYHDGSWWGLDIHARDLADAKARVAKLGRLQLQGELKGTIPALPCAGWFVQALCAVRNWWNNKER